MKIIENIQFQQLINLTLLLGIAIYSNFLQISIIQLISIAIFAIAVELFILCLKGENIYLPYSAVITSFGIILTIGWTSWYIPYILVAASISQKWFIKIGNEHLFNPSNFAIIIALLLFYPKALPIVGQLPQQGYFIILAVILLALSILIRAKRVLISIAFIIIYIFLEYIIIGNSDPHWVVDTLWEHLYSTSFIVYSFFMLTDPRATPNRVVLQLIFSFFVALTVVLLDYFSGMHTRNIFIALFIASPIFMLFGRKIDIKELKKVSLILFLCAIIVIYILSTKPRYFMM